MTATSEDAIRSVPCPACALCGTAGEFVYRQRLDRLFGAAGAWSIKRCPAGNCGLFWLDPMPIPEDLDKAYARYYTHAHGAEDGRVGLLREAYQRMTRRYLASAYNYRSAADGRGAGILGKALYLFPLRRHETDNWIRSLSAVPQGRLLDVGCGSGEWLLAMRALGWTVEGVDFDAEAVRAARQRGLEAFCGDLAQRAFPPAHFDAVTLNHVLEHVPDPQATLTECHRILKPGGKLVVTTPNTQSLTHVLFKGDWRGLEPPRHLHMFSRSSLAHALRLAGFQNISLRSWVATSVIFESISLWRGRPQNGGSPIEARITQAIARISSLCELGLIRLKPSLSDCVGAVAIKR